MSQLRMFLSHSSKDKAAADQFARAFRQAGADVWYDEESLGAGHLRRTIMKELGARPIFVVLLSHAALESIWVLDECEWAYDLQRDEPSRVMLPVVLEQLEKADLNAALYLRSLKRVEAGDLRPLPITEAAAQALRLLGMTPAGQAPAPPAPQPSESVADLVLRAKGLLAQKQYNAAAIPLFRARRNWSQTTGMPGLNLGYSQGEAGHWQEELAAYERALSTSNRTTARPGATRRARSAAWAATRRSWKRRSAPRPSNPTWLAWINKALRSSAWAPPGGAGGGGAGDDAAARQRRRLGQQGERPRQPGPLPGGAGGGGAGHDAAARQRRAWTNKASALISLGRYQEALAAAERATTLQPDNAGAWNNRGDALNLLGRHDEALALLNAA